MKADTIVIGAGYAGLMAALQAVESGQKTLLVSKGVGTTHWTPGSIDILGYDLATSELVQDPRSGVGKLIAAQPDHPYAHAGLDSLDGALAAFLALTQAQGLPYAGSAARNLLLPSPIGAARPTALAPLSMAAGNLTQGGQMLIIGFSKMRDFYPLLTAGNLTGAGYAARGISIDVPVINRYRFLTNVILAQMMDDPAVRREVVREVKAVYGREDRVGFPAVLGFRKHPEVMADLERALGVPVFEIPTPPPSVPGFRLYEAFRKALEYKGVRMIVSPMVLGAKTQNGAVEAIETDSAGHSTFHSAGRFILATGGLAGGGIATDYKGNIRETVFNLPLHTPPSRGEWIKPLYLSPTGHPIFHSGVMVNDNLQPVDASGQPVFNNVRVVGSQLAHLDEWREKSHEGVSLSTGWKAGRAA
ncbi:MAG: glycerol-3-phosphate dehydrogenase subunit GlpB [Anaerolineae bacterium]